MAVVTLRYKYRKNGYNGKKRKKEVMFMSLGTIFSITYMESLLKERYQYDEVNIEEIRVFRSDMDDSIILDDVKGGK